MTTVTVRGASGEVISLSYDNNGVVGGQTNTNLAQTIANAIAAGISGGSVAETQTGGGAPPPPVPPGETGLFVQVQPGTYVIPRGYDEVLVPDSVTSANLIGNGDPNQQILVGSANLSYLGSTSPTGSGTIVGGGGNNVITLPFTDAGNWLISLGDGNNLVRALGGGADTISTGTGQNTIQAGTGATQIFTAGTDTIIAAGNDTIHATGTDVVHGGTTLMFVGGLGSTIYGGGGSDTILGGQGPDLFYGGTAGHNSITAGMGTATLFGGGYGDQLFASGAQGQVLYAGPGTETLSGANASGADTFVAGPGNNLIIGGTGTNTYVASLGNTTIQGVSGATTNVFEYIKGSAGGTQVEQDLTASQVQMVLLGYGNAYQPTQSIVSGNLTVTLSDNTKITFTNIHSGTITNITSS